MQELKGSLAPKCPFCRHPIPGTKAESDKNVMKRIETDDSVAMSEMGVHHYHEGDYSGALKYLTKAAELGHIGAHHLLSELYVRGKALRRM